MKSINELLEAHGDLLKYISGDSSTSISQVSAENHPESGSLVFLSKINQLKRVLEVEPGAICFSEQESDKAPKEIPGVALLSSPNLRLAMAIISKNYFALDKLRDQFDGIEEKISPQAFVHPSAKIGENVLIGPFAYVGKKAVIGDDSIIAASAAIQSEAVIGSGARVHEHVYIGHGCVIGNFCELFPGSAIGTEGYGYASSPQGEHFLIPHQGRTVLEDHVHIGAGTKIDRGTFGETRIGQHTKIDNQCHIAHNCKIGRGCLLTGGFMIAGSATLGDFCVAGGRTTVNGHVKVTDKVTLGGLSGVQTHVKKPGTYQGFPLVEYQDGVQNLAALRKIGKMRKDLKRAIKHLGLEETK